jgi:hypothetical protein
MNRGIFFFSALCFALALAVPAAAQEDPPGDPGGKLEDFCSQLCPGASCTEPCRSGFNTWTTCGAYAGNPPNDLDSDGVPNSSDNCTCTANANQANCDGDVLGDACDLQNEKWVFVQTLGRCDLDYDSHSYYRTVEQYGTKKYQNLCGGAICYDRYVISDADCNYTSSCGYSDEACCDCNYPFTWCLPGSCPTPSCPF